MDKIHLVDLDLLSLEKFKIQGTKSTMYHSDNLCIKILDKLYPDEKSALYKKLLEMDGLVLDDVLLPKELIIQDGKLVGYTMDYFKNSINILDYLTQNRFINCNDIFSVVKRASLILRHIHENEVICQDLSFDNILIDQDGNIKYSDIDGCAYKNYQSPFMSVILKRFLIDYRKDSFFHISKNTDRISFLLSFYLVTYLQELQRISKKKYHSLSDSIKTLENLREYANMLLGCSTLPEIPYVDELIDDNDDYVIDRNKQLSLRKRFSNIISCYK